ncbi:UDP-glucose 4-epimerase [Caballeronia sordidicola]|uniref:UDP-glucose 4-epimerase n=1 Tax=Caballeronia sordidicola TaxID=196367 RepID=A0A242N1X5_CABSO|nr:UDP-glucose 4-epimerase [Caballeronia sordidicola]
MTVEQIEAALSSNARFDGVIHLAGAGVAPTDRDSATIFRVNAFLAPQMVSLAAKVGARAIVLAGSSAEYRSLEQSGPLDEDDPLETSKLYGASKAAGGILALANATVENVMVGVMRLFNVYGPGEARHRLLPSLLRDLSAGRPVKLSAGMQVRDFVYVDDVCAGLIAALTALADGKMPTGVYNIATGVGNSVGDFARIVAHAANADPKLLQFGALPFRPDDLPYVVGSPTKLRGACGWRTHTLLADGICHALAELSLPKSRD